MDSFKLIGTIKIYEGKKDKLITEYKNLVLDVTKKGFLNLLSGVTVGYGKYDYLVIGTGTNSVKPDDKQLGSEQFRKTISSTTVFGSNRIVIDTFIDSNEANFNWTEIGLVSGGELGTVNSGVLLNRSLIKESKTSSKSKTISWEVTIN